MNVDLETDIKTAPSLSFDAAALLKLAFALLGLYCLGYMAAPTALSSPARFAVSMIALAFVYGVTVIVATIHEYQQRSNLP